MFEPARPMSAPGILSDDTISKLKKITLTSGRTRHKRHIALRDHTIYTVALGAGLREAEIAALELGNTFEQIESELRAREWVILTVFKGSKRKPKARKQAQKKALAKKAAAPARPKTRRVYFAATVRAALETFLAAKRARREERIAPDAPLFAGRAGKPISTRLLRHSFKVWQIRAQVEHSRFHNLRHTAITRYYDMTLDPKATQDFAGHASFATTQRYVHVRDDYRMRTVDAVAASWG